MGMKNVCAPVTAFDSSLAALADDLLATMRAAPGVGITAAHIGVLNRVTVLELDKADGVRLYVTPHITW
ncbi:peptide deformylase, partial [Rhizobium leguminosarum]|uniref:peptide deformylase n=1 Tax=Rhizobium leguminosarum TaxID=384 RepID=UPI003F9A0E24